MGSLLKKMPNFTKLPLLFDGVLGFETSMWAYYMAMHFGTMNTQAVGKITVQTLLIKV